MIKKWFEFLNKKEITLEEKILEIQRGNKILENRILEQYKPFIARITSETIKNHINIEESDEFSVALIAFHEAIHHFSISKNNSFLNFAKMVIKRRLIDELRKSEKGKNFEIEYYDTNDEINAEVQAKSEYYEEQIKEEKKEEIEQFKEALNEFKISFTDLVSNSPKHNDSKMKAIEIAKIIVENKDIMEELQRTKTMPIKAIMEKININRKTIERNRKYIITMVILLNGDFQFLKSQIQGVMK